MTTKTISAPPDQLRELLRCIASPTYFIRTYVQIQHPERGTIPFALWPWQAHLLDRFERDRQIILLKARQLGVTELVGSYALWLIRFHHSKKVIAISKNEDAASEIMERVTFSHAQLPTWLQAGPEALDGCTLGKANTSVLQFLHRDAQGNQHPSSIQSLPATKSAGRSKSVALLILDEWAHQQFDREIWSGAKATAEYGQIIGISTANGLGNTFHRIWIGAVAKENTFTPIFLSWRRHPERDDAWYAREARDTEPWQMHQEYPSEPNEAFIQSGRPVFDARYLTEHGKRLATLPGPLSDVEGLTIWEQPVTEERDAQGKVTQIAHQYVIGADVAEGTADGDFDAAAVLDRQTWHQVAELHGRWPLEVYAQKLVDLARHFNTAYLVIERNNHGHAVLLKARELGYPNLYQRHGTDDLRVARSSEMRIGWETNSKSKPLIIGDLAKGLRSGTYQPRSQAFLGEALVYAYQDNGSMSAPPSYHDDRVMAHAIGVHILSQPDVGKASLAFVERMRDIAQQRAATIPPFPQSHAPR